MPELAEVECARRHLEKLLKGQKIKDVTVDAKDKYLYQYAQPAEVQKALIGAKIIGSGRRGKYLWLELDKKPWPIFHLGMTGSVNLLFPEKKKIPKIFSHALNLQNVADGSEPARLWFCRFLMKMQDGTEMAFIDPRRFGRIWLSDDPENLPRIKKLGYDPLEGFPTAKVLQQKINKRRVAIKTILLDQALFAGVGNYLADEILFQARISPHRLGNDLNLTDIVKLRKMILTVVKKAVALDANYELFPKNWLFHRRWGKSKNAETLAGQKITHDQIGGRTSAWVPSLQK
jgi:formamidopyrimidine-DNA glycosylase